MSDIPVFKLPNIEIMDLIGRGGMASVWRARQISLTVRSQLRFCHQISHLTPKMLNGFAEKRKPPLGSNIPVLFKCMMPTFQMAHSILSWNWLRDIRLVSCYAVKDA